MKRSTIILAIAFIAVVALLYFALARDEVAVTTDDADMEATIPVTYDDGSTESVKQFKSAESYYDDKVVESVGFSVDIKWKPKRDNIWMLCPRADPDQATRLTVYAKSTGQRVEVSEHPLGALVSADFVKVETGVWYDLYKAITVTMSEVGDKIQFTTQYWSLIWVLDVWYAVSEDAEEALHFTVEFSIEMEFKSFTPADGGGGGSGGGKSGGGSGGGAYDPSTEPAKPKGIDVSTKPWEPVPYDMPWAKGIDKGGKLPKS